MFLVEQNAFHALKLAHRGYVMVNGLITMSGTGRELLDRPEITRRLSGRRPMDAGYDGHSRSPHSCYEEDSFGIFLLVTSDRRRRRLARRPGGGADLAAALA